jgi:hypothetical protein
VLQFRRNQPEGRFLELTRVEGPADCDQLAAKLSEIFQTQLNLNGESTMAVRTILAEMVENVFHHAASPTNPLVCCQSYPKENRFSIAMTDLGVGIRHSMQDNPESLAACLKYGPLQAALQKGVTGRPFKNSGLGLFYSSEIVRRNGGIFRIQSQHDTLSRLGESLEVLETEERWPGTLFYMTLRTDQPLMINEIYRENPIEGDEDDIF